MAPLLAGLLLLQSVTLTAGQEIRLADTEVRLGDLASGGRADQDAYVVASVPEGGRRELTRSDLARLVNRRLPGVTVLLGGPEDGAVTLVGPPRPDKAGAPDADCLRLVSAIPTGRVIRPEDAAPASCDGVAAPVSFDRVSGVVRAGADLRPGDNLGRLFIPDVVGDKGDEVTIYVAVGPVVITRQVEALEPAKSGERLFVRDQEGDVFSVPFRSGTDNEKEEEQ